MGARRSTVGQLQSGELKVRARVLEGERAARRQAVVGGATVNAVAVAGLANMVRLSRPASSIRCD